MERDDLTTVKYIGTSRMKSLNDSGIPTIKQLSETPIEELTRSLNLREISYGCGKDHVLQDL